MNSRTNNKYGNRKQTLVAVCVLASGWLVMTVNAEDKRPVAERTQKFYPALTPFEQKFQQKLTEKIHIEFVETPLEEVIQHFQKFSGASFVISKDELELEHLTLNEPVSMNVPGVSFRSALRLVLKPLELSYVVEQDYIKITTMYQLENERLKTRVYPVGDLCQSPADYLALEQAIKNASLGMWKAQESLHDASRDTPSGTGRGLYDVPSRGGTGESGSSGKVITVPNDSETSKEGTLTLILTRGQRVHNEAGLDGSISVVSQSRSLVISQTYQAHNAIVELLTQLRQARALE